MTASRVFLSNHAGGILGGISTGQPVVARFAVKPTSSILAPRKTIEKSGAETEIVTKGRHDPCVGIRAVPVGEAMMASCWPTRRCGIADRLADRAFVRNFPLSQKSRSPGNPLQGREDLYHVPRRSRPAQQGCGCRRNACKSQDEKSVHKNFMAVNCILQCIAPFPPRIL